jgi:hypothetical protein
MFDSYYKILMTLQSMQTSENYTKEGVRKWRSI